MKLQYGQDYLSIRKFDPVVLPNLVVLTGVNGSGKSHLLESIENGQSVLEGIQKTRVVRFNYETFRLENEEAFNAHQISSERESAWQYFQQHILPHLKSIRQQSGPEIEALKLKCAREDAPFMSRSESVVEQYRNTFNVHIDKQSRKGQHGVGIYALAQNIVYPIDEISRDEFVGLYRPYSLKNEFLPTQLGKVFWDYYVKYRGNQVNEFQNEKYGKSYKAIPEAEFASVHGPKPWDSVNEILAAFETLRYRVNSPEGEDYFGSFQLRLIPLDGVEADIQFNHLSSGEKILMALVAAIYKAASDGKFPEVILLDEVDASLHPAMIKNMLSVIENVFVRRGVKVILVTHSPTTVALSPDESVFVMNKSGLQRIEKKSKEDALMVLTQGFVTLNQGLKILGEMASDRVTIISEGHNSKIIERAMQLFEVKGVSVLTGLEAFTGKGQLRTLFDFFSKVNHIGKVVFVWDCDVTIALQAANSAYPFVIERNLSNKIAAKGIENAFPESVFCDDFVKTINLPGKDSIREFYEVKKREFSEHVVLNGKKSDFLGFQKLVDEVLRISSIK